MDNKIRSEIKIIVRGLARDRQGLQQIETRGGRKGTTSAKGVITQLTIEARMIVNTAIEGINVEAQILVVNQVRIHIMVNSLHQEVIMIDVNPTIVVMVVPVVAATTKVKGMIIDNTKSLESDIASLIPLNQHLNNLCGN